MVLCLVMFYCTLLYDVVLPLQSSVTVYGGIYSSFRFCQAHITAPCLEEGGPHWPGVVEDSYASRRTSVKQFSLVGLSSNCSKKRARQSGLYARF